MTPLISISGETYTLALFRQGPDAQSTLDAEKAAIFQMFIERDKAEFSFNPLIINEYPDIEQPKLSPFLLDPVAYIERRIAAHLSNGKINICKIVILTTYGDKLRPILEKEGYHYEPINMPAGPDNTVAFYKTIEPTTNNSEQYTLYLEVVNENDEKIRPTFVLKLTNAAGELCGGVCGSISESKNLRYSYIATLVAKKGMPVNTGSTLAGKMLEYLKSENVVVANLGTQTAAKFYEKHGFSITHILLKDIRRRISPDGHTVSNDLVIMEKRL